jgi:hypothetical protein
MTRIVTAAYRYKLPPRKRTAVAIAGPAIVRKANRGQPGWDGSEAELRATPNPPANDDRKPAPSTKRWQIRPSAETQPKSAIVTMTSRKRAKRERAERVAEPDDDPEATARVKAFFARMIRHK